MPGIAGLYDGGSGHEPFGGAAFVLREECRADRRSRDEHCRSGALLGAGPAHQPRVRKPGCAGAITCATPEAGLQDLLATMCSGASVTCCSASRVRPGTISRTTKPSAATSSTARLV